MMRSDNRPLQRPALNATRKPRQEPGFLRRNGLIMGACLVVGGGIAWFLISTANGPKPSAPKPAEISMIRVALPPPPTPPPTPPPEVKPEETPPPTQQQMIEQQPVPDNEQKPKTEAPQKAPEDAAPMGTNIQGDGPPDAFGLVGRGNGSIIGGRGTGNGPGGDGASSRWGWYAAQVQSVVAAALGRNPRTRSSTPDISVRIWPDANGRIERAELVSSTGDRTVDNAIQKEVLTGLVLREPPPADMPQPIVPHVTGRRP